MISSERLGLNLPSLEDEANINTLSNNFLIIDKNIILQDDLNNQEIVTGLLSPSGIPSENAPRNILYAVGYDYEGENYGVDLYNPSVSIPLSLAAGKEYDAESLRAPTNKALDEYLKSMYYDREEINQKIGNIEMLLKTI